MCRIVVHVCTCIHTHNHVGVCVRTCVKALNV